MSTISFYDDQIRDYREIPMGGSLPNDYWTMLERFNVPVEIRRNTFRGKSLGSVFTSEQKARIKDGTFRGFFVGDYWEIGGRIWRIVDIDYWFGSGYRRTNPHHMVIMPDKYLYVQRMNPIASTEGGYVNSEMRESGLNQAKEIINGIFGENNLLNHEEFFANGVRNGITISGAWVDSIVDLPNEMMMVGSHIMMPDRNSTDLVIRYTVDKTQLSLMKINPIYIGSNITGTIMLRDATSSNSFACIVSTGRIEEFNADQMNIGVRPVFGIIG